MSDVLPPPPPPRTGDSCWKWGAITCGIGCAGLLIVVILGAIFLGPRIRAVFQNVQQTGRQAQLAGREMKVVWGAIEKFHADKGRYPDSLEQLVPKYLSKRQLSFSQQPEGPPFSYHKPEKNEPATTTVLEYRGLSMKVGETAMEMPVRLQKDGEVFMNNQPLPTEGRAP